ncbi:MAG: two pore domain potassium channel family protein, partial [Bacteroidales bacterium]|nr:two pore domain potassium channel family protein [Bacteroidales bacterium]
PGSKTFINLEFNNGDVSFINTLFNSGEVSFKIARWGNGKVDFHYAKFQNGDLTFEQAEFGNGNVDFRTVEFGKGKVNFNRSVFGNGDVSFEGSELLDGKFNFKKAVFGKGNLNFELAEFENSELAFDRTDFGAGNVSFYNSRFKSLSLHSCHLDHYTDIRLSYCNYIDLSDTIVRDIIDLKPYEFVEKINTISFGGMRLIGRIYIDWEQNKVRSLIETQKNVGHRMKSEQYRVLKENFRVTGQYTDEDKAYVEFKRHEAKAELEEAMEGSPLKAIWVYPYHWFRLLVFDKAGLYATNPLRVIISMLAAYVFYSFVYVFLELATKSVILETANHYEISTIIGKAFYFSFVTYFTIGYGDFVPMGGLRLLAGLEAFTGLFLMSYFTVAFVRKILR